MNKFMKHQKLQFKPGSFRLNGLFRVVFLICCLLSAGLTPGARKENHDGIQGYTFIQRVKTTGKTFYLQDPLYIRRRAVL